MAADRAGAPLGRHLFRLAETRMTQKSVTRMSERALQDAIIDAAKVLGWRVHHQRPGRTVEGWRTAIQGHPGFPDLVLLRPPRLIFAELKSVRGRLDHAQALWLNGLDVVAGVEQYVWRPIDWEAGRIEDALR